MFNVQFIFIICQTIYSFSKKMQAFRPTKFRERIFYNSQDNNV